jgi:hypothetical protein
MSQAALEDDPNQHPAVRNYTLLCLAGLLLLSLVLMGHVLGPWALLPALVGFVALLSRWRAGPPMVLLTVAFLLLARHEGGPLSFVSRFFGFYNLGGQRRMEKNGEFSPLTGLILCAALFAFVAGHYRLQALARQVFPPDTRNREGLALPARSGFRRRFPPPRQRRSPERVTVGEIATLLLGFPFWFGLAGLTWLWLKREPNALGDLYIELWQALLLIWAGGLGLAVTAGVVGYLGMVRARPEEARVFLQDQLWRETGREQGRLNRWLTWARLRGQRQKEKTR